MSLEQVTEHCAKTIRAWMKSLEHAQDFSVTAVCWLCIKMKVFTNGFVLFLTISPETLSSCADLGQNFDLFLPVILSIKWVGVATVD